MKFGANMADVRPLFVSAAQTEDSTGKTQGVVVVAITGASANVTF